MKRNEQQSADDHVTRLERIEQVVGKIPCPRITRSKDRPKKGHAPKIADAWRISLRCRSWRPRPQKSRRAS